MSNNTIALPISCVFYGEITDSELEDFIQKAREALEICGYDFIKDLNPGTDCYKELWVTDALNYEEVTVEPVEVMWTEMIDLNVISIASNILKDKPQDSWNIDKNAASAKKLHEDHIRLLTSGISALTDDGWDFYTESGAIYSNDGCDGLLFADGSTLILEGGVWVVYD